MLDVDSTVDCADMTIAVIPEHPLPHERKSDREIEVFEHDHAFIRPDPNETTEF